MEFAKIPQCAPIGFSRHSHLFNVMHVLLLSTLYLQGFLRSCNAVRLRKRHKRGLRFLTLILWSLTEKLRCYITVVATNMSGRQVWVCRQIYVFYTAGQVLYSKDNLIFSLNQVVFSFERDSRTIFENNKKKSDLMLQKRHLAKMS